MHKCRCGLTLQIDDYKFTGKCPVCDASISCRQRRPSAENLQRQIEGTTTQTRTRPPAAVQPLETNLTTQQIRDALRRAGVSTTETDVRRQHRQAQRDITQAAERRNESPELYAQFHHFAQISTRLMRDLGSGQRLRRVRGIVRRGQHVTLANGQDCVVLGFDRSHRQYDVGLVEPIRESIQPVDGLVEPATTSTTDATTPPPDWPDHLLEPGLRERFTQEYDNITMGAMPDPQLFSTEPPEPVAPRTATEALGNAARRTRERMAAEAFSSGFEAPTEGSTELPLERIDVSGLPESECGRIEFATFGTRAIRIVGSRFIATGAWYLIDPAFTLLTIDRRGLVGTGPSRPAELIQARHGDDAQYRHTDYGRSVRITPDIANDSVCDGSEFPANPVAGQVHTRTIDDRGNVMVPIPYMFDGEHWQYPGAEHRVHRQEDWRLNPTDTGE